MNFEKILNELNKTFMTKLILDNVSFFRMSKLLEIHLIGIENSNEIDSLIKEAILFEFKKLDMDIKIYIKSISDIVDDLNEKHKEIQFIFNGNNLDCNVNNNHQINYYSEKDHIIDLQKKLQLLNVQFKFNVKELDDEELVEQKILEKDEEISQEILNYKNNLIKKTQNIVQKKDPDEMFTFGNYKKVPENFSDLSTLINDINRVKVKGIVYELEVFQFPKVNFAKFDLDDGYFAISCKTFIKHDKIENFKNEFKNGMQVQLSGVYNYDDYERGPVLNVNTIEEIVLPEKIDTSIEKRIEFNIHTKYSNLESVVDVKELFNRLKSWGHDTVGISDLFNVHAYPEIYNLAKSSGIKLNLGLQTNFLEDKVSILTNYYNLDVKEKDFVVFDIETTGLSNFKDKIIEIGAVKIRNKEIIEVYQEFVNPNESLSSFTTELTGITNEMVVDEDTIDLVMPRFLNFCDNSILVAHNAAFDVEFIIEKCNMLNLEFNPIYIDTLFLGRALNPNLKNHKLNTMAKEYNVSLLNHHRASDDAKATSEIFIKMLDQIESIENVNDIKTDFDVAYHKEYQGLLYVRNKTGLKNLYKIVSESNLKYLGREQGIPLQRLNELRDGLLVGTGNYKSKLFNLISLQYDDEVLLNELSYFDFVGIVPLDFSSHLVKRGYIRDSKHLKDINKKMIELAKKQKKLVIAIGDVYYLDKKDYPYRNILKNYPRKRGLENSGAFYLKNTSEMLENYDYLDEKTKKEIVIYNPRKLDELIDTISPIADGTFPPKIDNAEKELTEESYEIAKSIYGENLPDEVSERLDRELNSIISNGYAALYIIAKKLVKKSNQDGYLVGSRGSVGSSFAATMAEITEVNPLPAHYVCEECKYTKFNKNSKYSCGVDLPVENCPKCGNELKRDGFDIPFEVFLGFEGDKEPDIDLNFASVYQAKIHKYTESLFGREKVFRAGTLGTIADKTALGMAMRFNEYYPEEESIKIDRANKNRVKRKITGVKRATGQHAGGLIIVPEDKDIEDFTPIQYPADRKDSEIITTHFDYHAIDKNLLKLDLLGHNVPTIIRLLSDMSKVDASKVDLSDKDTMSIFRNTEKLNIKHEYTNINDGSLGIPEFGTLFVRGMLKDTNPTTFEELIRISGLSHGTDVWLGNAQELIKKGICELRGAICTRDDIMNYLISMGVDNKMSFDIMEQVRKGKGLKDFQVEEMIKNNVPQWYIDSCNKIKYMFPKAHAVAYVMMSYRIAYFKVHKPAYFYAVYFSNSISDFKYEHISKGLTSLTRHITELRKDPNFKVDDEFYTYELAEEMFARDIKFIDIDLYQSHPTNFKVIDDKTIIPPLMAIENVSEAMAIRIAQARKEGEFISKEDFSNRTNVNKTALESMESIGLFKGLQDTNQIDFFNF